MEGGLSAAVPPLIQKDMLLPFFRAREQNAHMPYPDNGGSPGFPTEIQKTSRESIPFPFQAGLPPPPAL